MGNPAAGVCFITDSWNSPTYTVITALKATGNQSGIVAKWKAAAEQWANSELNNPEAVAVRAWLPMWQVRPFYTAKELAPIWPMLAVALKIVERPFHEFSPARLAFLLDYGKLPKVRYNDKDYYVVERLHYWKNADAKEIENVFNG